MNVRTFKLFAVPILACAHDHHAISADCIRTQGLPASAVGQMEDKKNEVSASAYFLCRSKCLHMVDDDGDDGGDGGGADDDDHECAVIPFIMVV